MIALHIVSVALMWIGIVVTAMASIGCAVVTDLYDRLHFVSAVTSIGVPLIVVSQAFEASGWRAALKLVLIALLLFGTGPVTIAATARARTRERQREDAA